MKIVMMIMCVLATGIAFLTVNAGRWMVQRRNDAKDMTMGVSIIFLGLMILCVVVIAIMAITKGID